jgi:1-pyrroline-5-carboxylate dehydrogenase
MAETLELVDTTSEYALTGAVFSQDRYAIEEATVKLQNAAGNSTSMINQLEQCRNATIWWSKRITNDKAVLCKTYCVDIGKNDQRNFVTPIDYRYPF